MSSEFSNYEMLRQQWFGEAPLAQWRSESNAARDLQPWAGFDRARSQAEAGDREGAVATLIAIINQDDLESRHYLEAWHALRELNFTAPAEIAKLLLGVVVEVNTPDGLDVLAVYSDQTARYLNYSGALIAWETQTPEMDSAIDLLLRESEAVVGMIGPSRMRRPAPPSVGQVRLNFLTPSGLHFGQGPYEALAEDQLAGPVLSAAVQLMEALVECALQPAE